MIQIIHRARADVGPSGAAALPAACAASRIGLDLQHGSAAPCALQGIGGTERAPGQLGGTAGNTR